MIVLHKRYEHLLPEIEERYARYMEEQYGRTILVGEPGR
jgi:hypothetical protein